VAVGADQRVGIGDLDRLAVPLLLRGPHGLGEIFQVDLVTDAGAGRNDGEIGESLLAPLQEAIALLVLLVFARHVLPERLRGPGIVDHHRMVDDKIDRHERVDLARVAAERRHRVAHRREVHHRRHAGEVLHQHASGAKGDLVFRLPLVVHPRRDRLDILLRDAPAVLVAQQVLEHDLERERQGGNAFEAILLRNLQREVLVRFRPHGQRLAALETVEAGHTGAPKRREGG
jgi:hypothetical protein